MEDPQCSVHLLPPSHYKQNSSSLESVVQDAPDTSPSVGEFFCTSGDRVASSLSTEVHHCPIISLSPNLVRLEILGVKFAMPLVFYTKKSILAGFIDDSV